ncbi:YybH family protein [Dongia deserti]|uniref:YybH family protein n=1 Tax=Dongia deserti TaxID=2268030 RepID=UPI000E6561CD|nr:nuclear transport factor 2 family protein [Dongia deserti]
MTEQTNREPARDPQDLERLLIDRQHAGDVEGMVALFEPQAVVDCGEGRMLRGHQEIHQYFAEVVASGRKFARGEQQAPLVCGDLALTSTRLPDGSVTAEVARRQRDGTWLWAIDRYTIATEQPR